MSLRVCAQPGCPALIKPGGTGKCTQHQPTQAQRGYGTEHKAERKRWAVAVTAAADAGAPLTCQRCPLPVLPNQQWHLDHDDADRTRYLGPSHAECNSSAGGKAAHRP